MKILADAHIPYLKGFAEQLGEVEYLPGNRFTREAIKDKDALIVRTVTYFGEEILKDSQVKLICTATIGFDHIDTHYCDTHNIAWRTAPGCNADSVEQYITASLLFLARKHHLDLSSKTVGIIGVGNVGSRVEKACKKLGMNVLLNDPPLAQSEQGTSDKDRFVDLETIKNEADIITLHTPLTKSGPYKTLHLADNSFFDSLHKQPFIINSCRGGVVDTRALKSAIKSRKIAGCVIDCWENEPNIDLELLQMADIATPHVAGYSADGKWTATRMSIENINRFFELKIHPLRLSEIPQPPASIIDLQAIPSDEQVTEAVWQTYNPAAETKELKKKPDEFYTFQANYPLRPGNLRITLLYTGTP